MADGRQVVFVIGHELAADGGVMFLSNGEGNAVTFETVEAATRCITEFVPTVAGVSPPDVWNIYVLAEVVPAGWKLGG
jgi:hypothetical protein